MASWFHCSIAGDGFPPPAGGFAGMTIKSDSVLVPSANYSPRATNYFYC